MGVRRPLALGQHVLHAYRLQHGTHGTAGDDTRTGSGRTNHHLRTAETHLLLVGNRTVDDRHLDEVLLGILDTLGDGRLHLRSLTQTVAHNAVFVTHDDDRREAECTTTLRYLGNTLDAYEPVFKLEVACTHFLYVRI